MAAGRIKGITIEIDGNTIKLQKAISEVDKKLTQTQKSLRDVEKLLKMNPGNTELLTQKQKLLGDAVRDTKERLEQLRQAQSGIEKGTKEWDALQREIVDTEGKLKSLKREYNEFGSVGLQKVAALGEKMKELGGKITEVGETMTTRVTAPLVALGAVGVAKFAEVDKTMQLTNATMANTAEEAKMLDAAMKEAAANSTFGMSDAATATLNFARAGLDAQQAAAALAPAMNLAAGEGGNLDTVSAGLVATINGFGDSFEQTAHYADIFAAACNNSALDVDSLSSAMSVAAPIFAASGKSVEDAARYMGIMANAGIDAGTAANSLKTGFARLAKPTDEAAEALEALGVKIFEADGSMKDSLTIQQELHDAFAGLSEQEQLAAASAIFGKNQMAPWLALINTGTDDVQALADNLGTAAGTTDAMAEAMMGGFGGSIEQLKSSIDVLMTTIGQLLATYLQPVVDKLTEWVTWFQNLDKGSQDLIVKIGLVVAAIGPLLVIVGSVLSFIGTFMTALPALGAIVAALTSPIALVVAAVAVLAVGIVTHWDEIKAATAEFVANIKAKWDEFKNKITEVWNNAKNTITTTVSNIKSKIDDMKNKITTVAGSIYTTVKSKFDAVKTAITNPIETAKNTVQNAINRIKSIFSGASFSLPKIKLPHFSWSMQDIGGIIKLPKISVDWYAKAYDQPYLFTEPTVTAGLRGFGDRGRDGEFVYGRQALMRDIAEASGGDVTFNIYATPGMDVNELATAVNDKFVQWQRQREAAYA